jgi:hypothetical protein
MHNPSLREAEKASFPDLLTPALLAVITFLSHFWYFRSFGIYEDDWAYVPRMFWPWAQIGRQIIAEFINWPQGRPLHFALPLAIGGLNAKWGGLPGIYLGGYLIVVTNILLFYYLAKRCLPGVVAVAGALTFCLFPADTTKLYINCFHSFQTSLTFLLLASLCHLSGRRLLSYFLITGALLTYETAFWPFAAVPLLQLQWNKGGFRRLARHVLILGVIFAAISIFRLYSGEPQLAGLWKARDFWWQLFKDAVAMGDGPMVSIGLTLVRPLTAIRGMSWDVGVLAAAVFLLSLFLLWREPLPQPAGAALPGTKEIGFKRIAWAIVIPESLREPLKVGLVGLILISLSYALSFHHFPLDSLAGLNSGCAHVAATFGMALLGSSLSTVLLLWAQAHRKKIWAVLGLALFFSLLAGFHVLVQKDFVRGWAYTKQFWGNVLKLCPDATEGTLIFVEDHGGVLFPDYICLHSWNHQVIPTTIFHFPERWGNPPRLFTVLKDWRNKTFVQGENIMWGEVTEWIFHSKWIVLAPGNVIVLKSNKEGLVRVQGAIQLGGREFPLKKPGPSCIDNFERTPMFDLLIDPSVRMGLLNR